MKRAKAVKAVKRPTAKRIPKGRVNQVDTLPVMPRRAGPPTPPQRIIPPAGGMRAPQAPIEEMPQFCRGGKVKK